MSNKSKINIGKIERRTFATNVQLRNGNDQGESSQSRTIEGYAAVFNSETDMGLWTESIAPGAFDGVLKDDVRALFNHDSNLILARSNNTLEIWQDEKGLGYRFDPPNTTVGNDLIENLSNGNVTQSSFGFTIEDYTIEERDGKKDHVVITKVGRLFDVSPVTFPAYETTEATARSIESTISLPEAKPEDIEERAMDLYDVIDLVTSAFYSEFDGLNDNYYYIQSIAVDNTLVAKEYPSRKLFKLGFEVSQAGDVSFQSPEEWQEVQKEYVPVQRYAELEAKKMISDGITEERSQSDAATAESGIEHYKLRLIEME